MLRQARNVACNVPAALPLLAGTIAISAMIEKLKVDIVLG
jgi:hypothetical protein